MVCKSCPQEQSSSIDLPKDNVERADDRRLSARLKHVLKIPLLRGQGFSDATSGTATN
jgi:hypothetical protein